MLLLCGAKQGLNLSYVREDGRRKPLSTWYCQVSGKPAGGNQVGSDGIGKMAGDEIVSNQHLGFSSLRLGLELGLQLIQ